MISTLGQPSFSIVSGTLASAVAANGTFTCGVPSGKDAGNFFRSVGHKLVLAQSTFYYPVDFDMSISGSTVTITNKTSATWAVDSTYRLQMNEQGERATLSTPAQDPNPATETFGTTSSYSTQVRPKLLASTTYAFADLVTLGAPVAAAANNICLAQSTASSGALTLNGSLVSGGVATLDVPRGVCAVSTGAATTVLTITGKDVYNQTMVENITLNGTTTVNGNKAFKTISAITVSAATTNPVTVGTTDKLGLPVYLPSIGNIVAEIRNGAPVTGGGGSVDFSLSQVDLLAGTAQNIVSPVAGTIRGISVITQETVATGGTITVKVGTTDVTGLSVAVPDASAPGAVVSDSVAATDGTDAISVGSRIQVVPGSTFATSGVVNGMVFVSGLNGAAVIGAVTAGGATATTGDVRGTYTPGFACDGTPVQLIMVVASRNLGQPQFTG